MSAATATPENKASVDLRTAEVDEETEALEGYVVDPTCYENNAAGLKTSDDGRFVLIPQPLDTPDDPLNWSAAKKMWILGAIAYIALLADYTGGSAIITIIPQSMYATPALVRTEDVTAIDYISAQGMASCPRNRSAGRCRKSLLHRGLWALRRAIGELLWSISSDACVSMCHARHVCLECGRHQLPLIFRSAHHQWLLLQRRPRRRSHVDQGSVLLP